MGFPDLTLPAQRVHQHVESLQLGRESGSEDFQVEGPGGRGGVGPHKQVEEVCGGAKGEGQAVPDSKAEAVNGVGDEAGVGVLEGEGVEEGRVRGSGGSGLEGG